MNPRLLRPRASGFNPKSIAGLQAWYDFSDTTTLGPTAAGVGTVTNNGPVKFVKDKSSSGYNLTQPGPDSSAPSFVASSQNGLPALSFDGGDCLDLGVAAIMTTPFSLFIVCKANATGTTRVCGVGSTRSIGPFANSNTNWGFFSAGGVRSFGVAATSASVLAMTSDASRVSVLYGNGTQSANATIDSMTPLPFGIGTDTAAGGGRINGVVYECLSYSSALSASTVASLTRYLGRKWGITVA
jgi:hypothetical protein